MARKEGRSSPYHLSAANAIEDHSTTPQFSADIVEHVKADKPAFKRRAMIAREHLAPDVTRMIADAYTVIDCQLGHFRADASFERFTASDATVLSKLVQTLKVLQECEQKRIAELQLSSFSKESLELLAEQASKFEGKQES